MLIGEISTVSLGDIIRESDEYILKSMLDTIILKIKEKLTHNKNAQYTLKQVMNELNIQTDSVFIDPLDDERRNNIIQTFEKHGMSVERGSGNITLQNMGNGDPTDPGQQEKEQQTQKIAGKAMDNVKKNSEDSGMEL